MKVNSTNIGFVTAHSYKTPHHCPAEIMVELVNHKKQLPVPPVVYPISYMLTVICVFYVFYVCGFSVCFQLRITVI